MQEQRWRYERRERLSREGGNAALTLPSRDTSDTALIDLRDAPTRLRDTPTRTPASRRFAPYLTPESDRDALASVALAAYQTSSQAPSVLDVDTTSLRVPRSRPRIQEPVEPPWTPPALAVEEPVGALALRPDDDLDATRRRPRVSKRGKWVASAAALGLVALLGGGMGSMLREPEGQGVAPLAANVVPAEVADPALLPEDGLADAGAGPGQTPVASVEGKLALSEATLHDRLAGPSAPAATSFPTTAEVILWLGYASWEPEADDRLGVIWFREGTEVGRSDVELSDGAARTLIAAPALQPGPHHADVTLNDEVVASVSFEIIP